MLEDAYSLPQREGYYWSGEKNFKKGLSVVLMGFLPLQETLSHPLIMPLLEDPKMEQKILLSLRLGLFQQSAEVNIFTMTVFPPSVSS